MPTTKPSPKPTKSPSTSTEATNAQMPLRSSRIKAPGVPPGALSFFSVAVPQETVMRTVFFVVLGFGEVLVAFGVTEMVTEQAPVFVPFTDVPDRLQNFFEDAAIDSTTFEPAGMDTPALVAMAERLIVRPIRTAGAAVLDVDELDVGGGVTWVIVVVVVLVVVVLGAVTKNFGAENEMSLIVTMRPATPLEPAVHLVHTTVSAPRLVVSDFRVMFMRLDIDSLDASALTLN
ncbi:MAG: hypothetical protein RL419_162 [Actinomycetota bacterium]